MATKQHAGPRARELTFTEGEMLGRQFRPCPADADPCRYLAAAHSGRQYRCGREHGHAGPHVAFVAKGPIATWKDFSDPA